MMHAHYKYHLHPSFLGPELLALLCVKHLGIAWQVTN
jgi:hypothetical protein